jgi:hypothetical protein
VFFLVAYKADIVQQYAERNFSDPGFGRAITPIAVRGHIFGSERGCLHTAEASAQKDNSESHHKRQIT